MTEFEAMPKACAADLVKEAYSGYPKEVCGLVMKDWTVCRIANVSEMPHSNFEFSPHQLVIMMEEHHDEILGVWHSHPGGNPHPSDADCVNWAYPDFRYWVVTMDDVYEWKIADGYASPVTTTGTRGSAGLAYPVLATAETIRR